jgi:integrase
MARTATGQLIIRKSKRGKTFAARIRANGDRHYVTLGHEADGMNEQCAREELANVLADVRRGIWRPPTTEPVVERTEIVPTFHEFASEWVERRRGEVDDRTVEHWKWSLSSHLLPFFASFTLEQFTAALVDRYRASKIADRAHLDAELELWQRSDPKTRGPRPRRPPSNSSINKTLKTLAQVLDDGVDYGYLTSNPARGKKRRLKTTKPKRTWLELDEVRALLDAAGRHRALLATMILAGLRIGELVSLRWRDVDLARGRLHVRESKTDAGERTIDLTPLLLDELKLHRANTRFAEPADLVFATRNGTARNRSNVTRQILQPAMNRANERRSAEGLPPIERVTNHSLRRTFASLLYEAAATPAYVMAQMGHESSALALEVYAKVMERKRDTGERMDALLRRADFECDSIADMSLPGPLSQGR